MNSNKENSKKFTFYGMLKTLFFLLITIQVASMMFTNVKKTIQETIQPKTQIGHLTIKGFIGDSTFYVKKIRSFAKRPEIKALLIKINSPGGIPGSSQAIFNELTKFKEKKPVVILVENVCASAAYYIAAASNHIIANPSSLVGSIGSFAQLPNIKGLMDDWKIKFKFIQSGKYKTAGNPFSEPTEEEMKYLQQLSDDIYEQFVSDVSKSRKLKKDDHKKWSDGKVFTGSQALKLKLIDQTGSLDEAITEIKKLAEIPEEEDIKFIKHKAPSGLMKFLKGEDDSEDNSHFSSCLSNFFSNVIDKTIEKQQTKAQTVEIN